MPLGDPQLLINANRTREVFGTRHLSGNPTYQALTAFWGGYFRVADYSSMQFGKNGKYLLNVRKGS